MKVTLTEVKGPAIGRSFDISSPDVFLAGRAKDAHIRFSEDDPYISRKHFLLEVCPPRCIIRNLSTKNQAAVNGEIVSVADLNDGDIIEIGYTHLEVTIETDLKMKKIRCGSCKVIMEVMADESNEAKCSRCATQTWTGSGEDADDPLTVRCQCGVDLTNPANSDGQAHRLKDDAEYRCYRCMQVMINESGRKVGAYHIIRLLGEGGMGEVSLVYHPETSRILVIKEIFNLEERALVRRFQREVSLLCSLDHGNLVRYVDSSHDMETPYLIMTFANSGNLDDLVMERGKLPVGEAIYYLNGALKGLGYIHSRNIVHRDIKPENILLHNSTGIMIPKITDFGIAKRFQDAGGTLLTGSKLMMGTPLFLPPEQIYDFRNVRETGDIFSMGVTLFYLLTGKVPFNFPSSLEIESYKREHDLDTDDNFEVIKSMGYVGNPFLASAFQEAVPILEIDSEIPEPLAAVVDKAILRDPDSRYQTAEDFRQALMTCL